MVRVTLAVLLMVGTATHSFAGKAEDDATQAAETLARVDFCDTGISKAQRASLMKRMRNPGAEIDGMAVYESLKSSLASQSRAVQARACEQVQGYETN